jgi:rhomboid protease GluP
MFGKARRALVDAARYELSAPVNLALIVISAAIFGVHQYLSRASEGVDWLWLNLSFDRYLVLHGQPWRLISPNLIHTATWWEPTGGLAWIGTPGLLHLASVLVALLAFGPLIERTFGHRRYLVIYAAAGLAAYAMLLIRTTPANLHGGATGAVYGVFAAFLIVMLRHWREAGYNRLVRPAIFMFLALTAAQYGWSLWSARLMHVGGFAAGIFLGLVFDPGERDTPPTTAAAVPAEQVVQPPAPAPAEPAPYVSIFEEKQPGEEAP